MEKELFFGMGRGYMLAVMLTGGFIAMMIILAATDAPIGNVQKWAETYTTFAAPILAIVVLPKAAEKIFKKKEG